VGQEREKEGAAEDDGDQEQPVVGLVHPSQAVEQASQLLPQPPGGAAGILVTGAHGLSVSGFRQDLAQLPFESGARRDGGRRGVEGLGRRRGG